MPLKFNDIAKKLNVSDKPKAIVLLLEYGTIKHKLDNPETQTWYFKKDIEGGRSSMHGHDKTQMEQVLKQLKSD